MALFVAGCPAQDPTAATTDATADDDAADTAADDDGTQGTQGASTGDTLDPNAPKYYEDVLPLFIDNCSSCHVAGGLGPFDLEDYATAKGLAEAIVASTHARAMPPFNVDNTGECNLYADARWLQDDEIDLIARWVEGGAQAGDPDAPRPERPAYPSLQGTEFLELSTPTGYLPVADQSGPLDDYQCFLAELNPGDAPIYIQGYEVTPGNPQVTHHMVGFLVNLDGPSGAIGDNRGLIQLLDDASPDQPGWDCFGAAGQGVLVEGTPVTWAPGGGAFNFPEGTGIRIDPGYGLVMQTHYNLVNGIGEDTTHVRLSVTDSVEREAVNALFDRFLFTGLSGGDAEIPPGQESYVYSWSEQLRNFDDRIAAWDKVEIFGVLPHMHEMGRRMQVSYKQGSEETCGMYVDRWDFQWQQAFMYQEPFILGPDDVVEVTCEWNSVGKNTATQPGLGTQQEMCLFGIYAAEG